MLTTISELDQASRANQALVRRPSSRISVVSRPVSAFKPVVTPSTSPAAEKAMIVAASTSYSPTFGLSSTPPFALQNARQPSSTLSRPPSIPQQLNVFPPPSIPGFSPDAVRYGTSPSSLQTGALARALTNTAIRLIGTGANQAATAIARATAKRRPTVTRTSTGEIDPAEDELIRSVEDVARKAFVLFELGDQKLNTWHQLARPPGVGGSSNTPPSPRRKLSSSSFNSEVMVLRQQQEAAGEATVLYCKALAFILQGTSRCQRYWENSTQAYETSPELNERELKHAIALPYSPGSVPGDRSKTMLIGLVVQWLRARFNETYEKAEWAKARAADELPFVDRLLHDKARDAVRLHSASCFSSKQYLRNEIELIFCSPATQHSPSYQAIGPRPNRATRTVSGYSKLCWMM